MSDHSADRPTAAHLRASLPCVLVRAKVVEADDLPTGDAPCDLARALQRELPTARGDDAIIHAIADAKASIERHTELKLLELRVAYEKANADMLLRLGGVMLCILTIAIAAARFLGIVY